MISSILKITSHRVVAIIAIILMVIGLQFPDNPVFLSIGMMLLVVNVLFSPNVKQNISMFLSDKTLIALTLIFFIFLVSGINSTDMAYYSERVRIKLPFLALPIAFVVFRGKPVQWFYWMLYLFFITIVILCGYEFGQYVSDYSTINKLYRTSYVIDTPGSHVRFSLMITFAIFVGAYLTQKQFLSAYKAVYISTIALTVFLIVYLHILAVRSGVLAFYLCLFYLVLYVIFKAKNYKAGALFLLVLIALPFIAVRVFPTLESKLDYTKYGISQYAQQHEVNHMSDGARIESEIVGYRLFRAHWLTGTGIGDMQDEMNKLYAKDFPDVLPEYRLIPHNEFLVYAVGCGIFGLLAFIAILLFVLCYKRSWQHWLYMVFNIIVLSSFLTEPTIEEQVGTAFYIIFILVLYFLIHYSDDAPVSASLDKSKV